MINCILLLILMERNLFTRKESGKILAALPMRMSMRLQMISSTLKEVEMAKTCMPMYRNTTVSVLTHYKQH